MADDGNRQVAIALALNTEQFNALDEKLGGIDGAINKLAEGVSQPDTDLAAQVSLLRNELGMRLTIINQSIIEASANIGKWLSAIALATSTPNDNSAEVQRQIDAFTSEIKSTTDAIDSTVKSIQS